MILFEDRSTYGPDDPVERLSVAIQCQPGQQERIVDFLKGLSQQAGVYCVAIIEREPDAEQPVEQPSGTGEEVDLVGDKAAFLGTGGWVNFGEPSELAGTAGKSGAGSVERGS